MLSGPPSSSPNAELMGLLRADDLGLISHEHSAVTNVEPLANLGETHSQAESSEAPEETRITVESLATWRGIQPSGVI